MAYNTMGNFSGDYSMPQSNYGMETEEERRRREEQERQAAMLAGLPPPGQTVGTAPAVAGPNQTLSDLASAFMNKQTDPVQQMPMGRDVEPEPTPVKQTITTDPITGEQKMKIEGSVQDLTAANPLTPTVSGPAVPAAMPQQAAPQPRPMPTPVPAQLPAAGPIDPKALLPDYGQVPVPGPATQFAGPATAGAMNQPFTGQGIRMPTSMPAANLQQVAQQLQQAPTFETRFTESANDIGKLEQLRTDQSLTKEQNLLAGRQMQQLLKQQIGEGTGKEELGKMSDVEMARLLKSKSEEGSYAKLLLLGFVSPALAAKEAAKLGLNDQWTIGQNEDGNSVLLKTRDGVPIEGYNPTTNKQLTAKELINTAGTTPGKLKPDVSTQDVEKDGKAGRVVTTYDAQNRPKTMVESGGKMFAYDSTWKPRAISTAAAKTDYNLAADLYKKHSGNVLDMMKEYEMIKGPMTDEGRGQFMRQYGYGSTIPAANATPNASSTTSVVSDPVAVQRAQADIDGLKREIVRAEKGTGVNATAKAGQLQVLNAELKKAQQQLVSAGGRLDGGVSTGGISGMKVQQEIGKAGALENIQVAGKRSESFNKYIDETLVPSGELALTGSDTIKKQMKLLNDPNNSVLFGLYDASQTNSAGDKRWAIIRDVLSGAIARDGPGVSEAVAQLNLNSDQRSALDTYSALNMPLVAATVKLIGGTQISDRDREAAEKAQVDIGRTPALGAFNIKSGQQFGFDMARYKADWATTQKADNIAELNKLWNREQARLVEQNGKIADQRMAYLKSLTGDKPANTAQVRAAFQRYQVPEYDPNLNGGVGGWKKLRQEDVKNILGVK